MCVCGGGGGVVSCVGCAVDVNIKKALSKKISKKSPHCDTF